MKKLTMEQAVVISAYTGFMICPFSRMHAGIEERLGRPVFIHELGDDTEMTKTIRAAFKDDFIALAPDENEGDGK